MVIKVGTHVIVEFEGCDPILLKGVSFIQDALYTAAKESNATIVNQCFKQFDPWGVSGVIVIAESHISIHTWPEYGLASFDYFSCSESPKIEKAIEYLFKTLKATYMRKQTIDRGTTGVQLNEMSSNKGRGIEGLC